MKKIIKKIKNYCDKVTNKEWEDYVFLRELCTKNYQLDLDKYDKLMSMVKRKYRK